MDTLRQNLRHTLRRLVRAPAFSLVAILTLAAGIGSNAAIFAVVDAVLLRPLPFEDSERLVGIWHTAPGLGFEEVNQSPALHFFYAAESRTLESVGMWDDASATVTGLAEPEQVAAMYVTHETLPLLGVRPALGRAFTPEEDSPDGPETVILSHGYWERRLGADPAALGASLTVNGRSKEIVGVLPEGLAFLRSSPDVYLPFRFDPDSVFVGNFSYQGVGRLREGVTLEGTNADVARMVPLAVERYPGGITPGMLEQARFGPLVRPLERDVVGDAGNVLWVLMGSVGIVLLIACANVANLFLVRAEGRGREVAVRTAMGAGHGRIVAEALAESLALGLAGGLLGLLLAWGGLELLVALGPESLPRLAEIGVDGRALAFTFGVSVLAGLLFGALPAVRMGRAEPAGALREGGRGGGAGRERHRARNALVVAQMALALVLLAGSGLLVRSFRALRAVDPGFEAPGEVLTFRVTIPAAEIEDPERVALAHQAILRGIQALPGVEAAALTSSATMDGWDSNDALESEANPVVGDRIAPIRRYKWIGEGYFAAMGNRIVAGRDMTWADVTDRARVVLVTESLARAEWGGPARAVGQRVRQSLGEGRGGEWYEVIGVVGDVRDDGVGREPVSIVYWPQVAERFWLEGGTYTPRSMAYVVRAANGDPRPLLDGARRAVWAVNPNLPVARVRTLAELTSASMARTSFTLVMLAIAAGVALFLGLVGIYGVVSYVVSQRTREIGVRMALGAEGADVRGMVLRQAMALAATGVALGLAGSVGLTRLMAALLFGVSPGDPLTLGAVSALLAAAAGVASWLPARRAAAVDPVQALRAE